MSGGLALRFSSAGQARRAARRLRQAGVQEIESFGPFPDDELLDEIPARRSKIPLIALLGGGVGAVCGYILQYWTAVDQYELNVGGRPPHSWPAFIPVTFELTVLFASCAIAIAFLFGTGLPRLHHPVFDVPDFIRASDDSFFIWIKGENLSSDELEKARAVAAALDAEEVYDVTL